MFSTHRKTPSPPAKPSPPKAEESKSPVAQVKSFQPSVINADLRMTGDLVSGGDVQIDGTVEGNVQTDKLTIGEHGKVHGSIVADNAKICGTVQGEVRAKSVTLTRTARVTGDILHETLAIEPGAFVDGHCKRSDKTQPEIALIAGPKKEHAHDVKMAV